MSTDTLTEMVPIVQDVIKTYQVGREFHQKLSDQMIGEYNRLQEVAINISKYYGTDIRNGGTYDTVDIFDDVTLSAETLWMDENHGSDPKAKKKNGQYKSRVYLPTAYSSAKSVVRRGLQYGTILKRNPETGLPLGKTALEAANKEAERSKALTEDERYAVNIKLLETHSNKVVNTATEIAAPRTSVRPSDPDLIKSLELSFKNLQTVCKFVEAELEVLRALGL